jgi:hypothetical protein
MPTFISSRTCCGAPSPTPARRRSTISPPCRRSAPTGHWLGICINAFSFGFCAGLRPWKIADPRSRAHGGVGAFNLVRASTYRKLGGHVPIHLRPDDDIKLGKLMKSGGFSDFVFGAGAISVAWYASVGEMIRGLEKNAYAAVDYRWWVPPLGPAGAGAGVRLAAGRRCW